MLDENPNAATQTQMTLKRIERAIRRRHDCSLFLTLDGISMLQDPVKVREALLDVQKRMEQ